MTEEELDYMELLWLRKTRVSDIARIMGYSVENIEHHAGKDRRRFPKRRHLVDERRANQLVAKVLDGSMTADEAARELGVHVETVLRRVRKARWKGNATDNRMGE